MANTLWMASRLAASTHYHRILATTLTIIIKVGMEDTNHNIINTALVVLLHLILLTAGTCQTDGSPQQDLIHMALHQEEVTNINSVITLIFTNLKIHKP